MSDLTPSTPDSTQKGGSGKRIALVAGGAVLAAAVVGGGVWGYNAFYGQGDQAAGVIPTEGLLGYVGFDLAPNGEQLLSARSTLKKFPAIADQIKLGGSSDLRKELFTKLQEDGGCKDLDWDKQVAPWLGDRVGVGVMDGGKGKEPEALLVLQTTDNGAAEKHLDAVLACLNTDTDADDKLASHSFVGDWLVLGEGKLAADMDAKLDGGSLADDESFARWTDEAGDPGILTGYVSKLGAKRITEALESAGEEMPAAFDKALEDFEGAGLVGRFRDGGVQLEAALAGGETAKEAGEVVPGGEVLASLPASTVAAFAFGLRDGWLTDDAVKGLSGSLEQELGLSVEDLEAQLTQMTGLKLADIETLLGDAVAVSVDADIDADAIAAFDVTAIPVGIKIQGDTKKIEEVLDKLRAAGAEQGMPADFVVSKTVGDHVVISLSKKYADTLASEKGLGSSKGFDEIVPDADSAIGAFFLDFNVNGWLDSLLKDMDAPTDIRDNIEPLSGIGVSSWVDGDVSHSLFTLTTD